MTAEDANGEIEELRARIGALEQLVSVMTDQLHRDQPEQPSDIAPAEPMTTTQDSGADEPDTPVGLAGRPTTRRNLMRVAGAASAGLVAGALAKPSTAAAADPNDVVKGQQNNTTAETEIRLTSNAAAGTSVFLAQSTSYGSSSRTAAVAGFGGNRNILNGVYGYTESRDASNTQTGHALVAYATNSARSHLYFVNSGTNPRNTTYSHTRGEIRCDSSGNLWYCIGSGTPGTWRKLSGNASAGTFNLLSVPVRAYDSRISEGGSGPLTGGTSATVGLQVSGVPNGFTGALVNLTVVTPVAPGWVVLYADGVGQPSTSSVNYNTGDIVGNNATTRVSAAGLARIFTSATTDYVVDVMGFFE